MIPAVTPPHSRPIESYSHETFMQSYGPNHHDKSAVNRNLIHEINSADRFLQLLQLTQDLLQIIRSKLHHVNSAANRHFYHEINPAVMIPAVAPTRSRPIENYPQKVFRQSYYLNHHANSAANRNLIHEINPAVMIPAVAPTRSRPIENYP